MEYVKKDANIHAVDFISRSRGKKVFRHQTKAVAKGCIVASCEFISESAGCFQPEKKRKSQILFFAVRLAVDFPSRSLTSVVCIKLNLFLAWSVYVNTYGHEYISSENEG